MLKQVFLRTKGFTSFVLLFGFLITGTSVSGQLSLLSSDPAHFGAGVEANHSFTFTFDGATPSDLGNGIEVSSRFYATVSGTWTGTGTATVAFTPDAPLSPGDRIEFSGKSTWTSATSETLNAFRVQAHVRGHHLPEFATSTAWTTDVTWSNDTTPAIHQVIGDFNGDGALDIAALWIHHWTNDLTGVLKTSWGNGDGTFQPFVDQITNLSRCHTLMPIDLDMDGDLDLAVLAYGGATNFSWYLNDGAGNFSNGGFLFGSNWYMDFADLDGDGDPDALTTNSTTIKIYENQLNQGGSFISAANLTNDYYYTYAPVIADFDGDGDQDLAVSSFGFVNGGYPEKWVWMENTAGMASGWVEHVIEEDATSALPNINQFKAADMDGDGDIDLVGNSQYLFTNNGTGTFTRTSLSGAISTTRFDLLDFDGDGDMDVVAAPHNQKTHVLRNDQPSWTSLQISDGTLYPGGNAAVADFTGDGILDVLVGAGDDYTDGMSIHRVLPYGGAVSQLTPMDGAASIVSEIPAVAGVITERGLAYGTAVTPTIAGTSIADASATSGSFTTQLTGLDANTTYYVRSYSIIDGQTYYSPSYSFTTPISLSYAVGDVGPAGGIIYYVDELDTIPEFDYLELAPKSVQVDRVWGCQGDPNPMAFPNAASIGTANFTGIGEGAEATSMIVAGCDELPNAAYYADSLYLVNNGELYDDWYLPTLGELTAIYDAIQPITGTWDTLNLFPAPPEFIPYSFWSSTEWYDTGQAQYWSPMYSNFTGALAKSQTAKVRPVRAFSEEPTFGASIPTPLVSALLPDTAACTDGTDVVLDLDEYFTIPLGSMTYSVSGNPAGGEFTASISGSTFTVDFSGAGDEVTAELTITATGDGGTTATQSIFVSELGGISIAADTTSASTLAATDGAIALTFDGGYPVLEAQGDPCGGVETINYHGVDYDLVAVGDQCWFGSNLQTTQFNDGTPLTQEVSNSLYSNGTSTPMYADPQGGSADLATFGYFYSSAALLSTENNLCPSGFHIPTQTEVLALKTGAVAEFAEGVGALADTVSGAWDNADADVTNASGFSMISGPVRANVIYTYDDGTQGWMGTSTDAADPLKMVVATMKIDGSNKNLYTQSLNNKYGYPARCLRDAGPAQGSYSPVWDHGPTSANLSGLAAGDYTVSVSDVLGCSAELDVTILALDLSPAADSLVADTVCFGAASMSLDLDTIFAGDPAATPLTYTVTGGPAGGEFSGSIDGTTLTVSFAADGTGAEVRDTLFITATDANLASFTLPWVLMERAEIALSGTVTDVSVLGGSDGAIDATVPSGTLSWSDGPTTEDRSGLTAGDYTLTVTIAATGCSADSTFTVGSPAQMSLSGNWNIEPASSPNSADGAIRASFVDGAGERTVTFLMDGSSQDIDFAEGTNFEWIVPAGVYYVLGYSDAAGSATTFSPALRIVVPNVSCD